MKGSPRYGLIASGVIFCAFFTFGAIACAGTYSGGSGSLDNPYQLANAADLIALSETPNHWYSAFILTADIDMDPNLPGGKVFDRAPIAPDTSSAEGFQGTPFRGSFDGNGHAIRNLTIRCGDDASYIGMFGNLGGYPYTYIAVKNLHLINSSIDVGPRAQYVGLLAGTSCVIISCCDVSGNLHAGPETTFLGGLVGRTEIDIWDCTAEGLIQIESGTMIGGLVGAIQHPFDHFQEDAYGWISGCSTDVQILGIENLANVGGLVGFLAGARSDISQSKGFISILGNGENIGGLVGAIQILGFGSGEEYCNFAGAYIDSTFSEGLLVTGAGSTAVGGLVGHFIAGGCEFSAKYVGWMVSSYSIRNVAVGDRSRYVGGLVGLFDLETENVTKLSQCYATGSVVTGTDSHNIGGLVGGEDVKVEDGFWDIETTGQTSSAGGIGKTTAEMKTKATYSEIWDIGRYWSICEGTNYPRMKWQIPVTDWVCPDGVALEDLLYLAGRWMASTPATAGAADANADGRVDLLDLAVLSENWGRE
jgi:hypothetical protein